MNQALLTLPKTTAANLLLAGPRLLARATPPAIGAAAGAAAGTARAGVRTADFAARAARAARAALPGAPQDWRAGPRVHVPLRTQETDERADQGQEHRARRLAAALAEHPDIVLAYWDRGLGRLVVTAAEGVATDRVVARVAALAERHGLVA